MQRIRKYRRKTGFSMLQIVWQAPQALQIRRFVGHAYVHYPQCALCSCAQPGTICR